MESALEGATGFCQSFLAVTTFHITHRITSNKENIIILVVTNITASVNVEWRSYLVDYATTYNVITILIQLC